MMVNEDFEMLHPGLPLCQKMSEIGLQHAHFLHFFFANIDSRSFIDSIQVSYGFLSFATSID